VIDELAVFNRALSDNEVADQFHLLPFRAIKAASEPVTGSTMTKFGSGRLADATKERPFVNSLGMEFVPVPGTQVLFCRWETRVKDYAEYARVNTVNDAWTKVQYNGVPAAREPEHPVSSVTWEEANAFCEWLTKKESAEGRLPKGMNYRLPTDEEWSRAVGLAKEQGATPRERAGKNSEDYPWGSGYPPPKANVGNYADSSYHEKISSMKWIEGYTDGYATTAPVGSFAPNEHGLCDMGGNVWEWCEDLYEAGGTGRVLRGASWSNNGQLLRSSARFNAAPNWHNYNHGFRCVVGASAR
jgi:formylglycine-generating enzyme required for sulfatase activity